MPNTPALVGQGMTGLFAAPATTAADRALAEAVIATTGDFLWVEREKQLDAVTAVSGSGPAYVFYFLEAGAAGRRPPGPERRAGAPPGHRAPLGGSALAKDSPEALSTLRERVTSKGGTTYAALTVLQDDGVAASLGRAIEAADRRAAELGDEFGR